MHHDYIWIHAEKVQGPGEEASAGSFPLSAWTTQQIQTHSRGHLHTNATLSENSGEPLAAWSQQGWQAGSRMKLRKPCFACLQQSVRCSLPIVPLNKPQMFRVLSARRTTPGLQATSHFVESPVICPVYVDKKRLTVETTELTTNVKETHPPSVMVTSKHPCTTWHQMSCQTLTK